ncbi:MAG TPA: SIS domain-containing protein [Candidatus Methylacidiphilales bacterium]|jgi:D-sedoheptulose 7-phosphate isomerase|nr:SIS domain-containing protein [Candidatus Methylacidiphilales bacterium]
MTHVQTAVDAAIQNFESLRALEPDILRAAELVKQCLLGGGKLLACGNGGSAADVSDFTTEYTCRFLGDRPAYPALNLTADGGLLAAIGNDYAFEDIFARQVAAFGKPGDVLIVATTSGRSKNILRALEEAKRRGLHSLALLGKDGGDARGMATVELLVPGPATARIQEAHKFLFHVICELVDPALKK